MDQNGAKDFKLEFGAVKRNANQFLHFRWGLVVSLFSFGFSAWFFPSFFPTSDSKGAYYIFAEPRGWIRGGLVLVPSHAWSCSWRSRYHSRASPMISRMAIAPWITPRTKSISGLVLLETSTLYFTRTNASLAGSSIKGGIVRDLSCVPTNFGTLLCP